MIWTTDTHRFTATTCQHTGRDCPALARMAEKLAGAMESARPTTTEDFEIEGTSTLDRCPYRCPARFRASHARIRIFCGVDGDAEIGPLDRLADLLLSAEAGGLPASAAPRPCAMVEVVPGAQG
ncbi:hypothetical protein SAMN05444007_107144 [Cribrihabitans marinus]|uniref:Uncharacterized protein n=1 Tax=Cribrihabitans marinus TaxID=1227549 RepID=A0A1H7BS79_9RHOB|nr:hypothetical protein [Cribrihabitans marinus]GGH33918.1 hypothetical protein GCM10010973_26310 [Cribrihabitans marinus]SEJ79884.1 hypothetical protein SAMN05444007_107144 [Cribrihabitans marinus]